MAESINSLMLPFSEIIQAISPSNAEQLMLSELNNASISEVTTDSRSLSDGAVFVALRGDKYDGHDYLKDCFDQGAVAAVVMRQCLPDDIANCYGDRLCLVDDTLLAYGLIAKTYREKLTCPVIALTGSAGKTSTKEMLTSILRQVGKVGATKENFNNEVGVPKTLLQIEADSDFAIIEMGAAKAGDIAYLMPFVKPDVSILTNAYAAHIQGFGSLDIIAQTKGEIFSCQPEAKVSIINLDDAYAPYWKKEAINKQQFTFSLSKTEADVFARNIQLNSTFSTFELVTQKSQQLIHLPCSGSFNIANALAASTAAISLGISLTDVAKGLADFKNISGRFQTHYLNDGIVLDDSYNANPQAMQAAIRALLEFSGERVLVLGAMAELGEYSASMHEQLAHFALEQNVHQVYFYSNEWPDEVLRYCRNSSVNIVKKLTDKSELLHQIQANWQPQQNVLVKGSRSMGMEVLVQSLIINRNEKQQGAC